jgi:predicted HNH restriction endonuclease
MNATQDYPHLSRWPVELGPAPTDDELVQAYALLLADRPRARHRGSHKGLAVAAYLSGHPWWPDDLGVAIDAAVGKREGAANDPRNVITEAGNGLEPRGLVKLHKQRKGRRETWSCELTTEGQRIVAAYCDAHGIENPVAIRTAPPSGESGSRNAPWTRDELILALDLYLRNPMSPPNKNSPEVRELSDLLNKLGRALGHGETETFRNANGVYMKMMNFRRFDPRFTEIGKIGLTRGNKDEEDVWREFAHVPERLNKVALAVRQAALLDDGQPDATRDDDWMMEAEEGRLLTRLHRARERNRKLVNNRKLKALHEFGRLFCEACDFDFEQRYGERGRGVIEAHHTRPLETLAEGSKTRLEDLALLCANCHRIVHSTRPWLSVEELRRLLVAARTVARADANCP